MNWLLLLAAPLAAASAPATEPTCTATGSIAATVCADGDLRAADAEVAALQAEVAAKNPLRATWAVRARNFRTWLEAGYEDLDDGSIRPYTKEELLSNYAEQRDVLTEEIARAGRIGQGDPRADFDRTCRATVFDACRVASAGWLNGSEAKMRILWQVQTGSTDAAGATGGVMLWDASGAVPQPIGWAFEGWRYEPPVLNDSLPEPLLWVPGTSTGMAGMNADLLFVKRAGQWVEVETSSWRDALPARLPKGFGVWSAIDYDLANLGGESPLWRQSDPNCCASGGRVFYEFAVEGSSLVAQAVTVERTGPEGK